MATKKTKRLPPTASSKPLFAWFDLDKANRGKLRDAGYSDGQISNWRTRGIPRAQLDQLAAFMGITSERYLAAAGEAPLAAREPGATYKPLSEEAVQIAIAFDQLQPQAKDYIREQVFIYTVIDKSFPWLRHGRPMGKTYGEFEKWHQSNIETKRDLELQAEGLRPRTREKAK